jgi:ABC-type bacteriocin/lantibiotic exporter with double-glycine peptidase domain
MSRKAHVAAWFESCEGMISNAGLAFGVWQASQLVLDGDMQPGSLISFFMIVVCMYF